MTHRQLTSLSLIVIIVFMVSLVELGEFVSKVRGESLSTAQNISPGFVQFPWANNSSFLFRNESSYLSAFRNGTSLKEPFALHGYGGFNGTVRLSSTVPPGISLSIAPSSVLLIERQEGYSYGFYNLTLAGSIPGTFTVIVTATNGTISNSLTITAVVTNGPDFVLIPSYPYSSITSGQLGSPEGYTGKQLGAAILVWSTGFQGLVNLSTQVSPPGPSATLSLSANIEEPGDLASQTISRYVQANGKNYTTLNFNSTNAADYTVAINGTARARTHSMNVIFKVRDFNLSLSTVNSVLPAGASLLSQIRVTALNGFSGLVNFTIAAPPSFSVTLSSRNVTGSGVVAMRVNSNSAEPGTYSITVNAVTLLYFTHSITLTIEVRSLFYIPGYTLPWIGAGTTALIVAAIYLLFRRRARRSLARKPV